MIGDGRNRTTQREPPTMGKQLVNFITCESSALFLLFTKPGASLRRIGDRLVWIWILVFNATFSNISAISWRPVLVLEEAGVPG